MRRWPFILLAVGIGCVGEEVGSSSGGPEPSSGDAGTDASPTDASPLSEAAPVVDAGPPLRAHYDFETEDRTSEFVKDRSGNGHDGVLEISRDGGAIPARGTGRFGVYAAELSDRKGRFRCPLSDFGPAGALSFWFRVEEPEATQESASIFDNASSTREHFYIRRPNVNQAATDLELGFQPGTSQDASTAIVVPFVVSRRVWTHAVITWGDGEDALLFVTPGDPEPRRIGVPAGWTPKQQTCSFGDGWIGAIDAVKIFSRRLTPSEVALVE